MHEFVIHSIPGSPFGRSVLMTMIEKSSPYRLVPVSPQTLRTPQHRQRHPFARVPVLEHGEFRLYETQAILRYLDRVIVEPSLTPSEPRAAAQMDQLMNINDWYLFQGVANVIAFQRIVGPRVAGLTPDESAIAAAMPKAVQVMQVLAEHLGEKAFFAGSALSLADLLLAPQLDFLSMTPEWDRLAAPHGRLQAWLGRMNARESSRQTTWERLEASS